jgi:hypothetical protein
MHKLNYKKVLINILVLFLIFFGFNFSVNLAYATCAGGQTCLEDPLGNKTPQTLIGQVINAALGVVGSLALAMFIFGGFTWMLSAGNSQAVEKGKNILIWATIGLIVIFTSYALVNFVFKTALQIK